VIYIKADAKGTLYFHNMVDRKQAGTYLVLIGLANIRWFIIEPE